MGGLMSEWGVIQGEARGPPLGGGGGGANLCSAYGPPTRVYPEPLASSVSSDAQYHE